MKRIVFLLIVAFGMSMHAWSDDATSASDNARIGLTAVVDDAIPAGARKQLMNKMNQIAAKNGCAATGNSRFVITCSIDELSKDITATTPAMFAYTLGVTFFVGDGVEGRLFSSTTIEAKGVGQTEQKAYINAINSIRTSNPEFKVLLDKGKTEIVQYYSANCDLILASVDALVKQNEYAQAMAALAGIPSVCSECYMKVLDKSVAIYQAMRDEECHQVLHEAQTAWAQRDAQAAGEAISRAPIDGGCASDIQALQRNIAASLDAQHRQEWDFKMQQYEDRKEQQEREREARGQSIEQQIQQNAVAAGQAALAQATPPTYNIKGKWFK